MLPQAASPPETPPEPDDRIAQERISWAFIGSNTVASTLFHWICFFCIAHRNGLLVSTDLPFKITGEGERVSSLPPSPSRSFPATNMHPSHQCSRCLRRTTEDMEVLPEGSRLVLPISDCARGGDHNWVPIAPPTATGINSL